ncbi:magnesium transporter CorA family protein [Paenibacillus sp. NPDC056579]|uniref:magnesium transporter CorA family protein n=1 Tax=Paenibacillus sp. NPDC056579 TaxID=3345871 RepID=UPI00367E6EB8
MTIRQISMPQGWTWHVCGELTPMEREELRVDHPHFVYCLQQDDLQRQQSPRIRSQEEGNGALYGSLLYGGIPSRKETRDDRLFFYVNGGHLFTSRLHYEKMDGLEESELIKRLQRCNTAVEGLFALLGELAIVCLNGLDLFAEQLTGLEQEMREFNNSRLLDQLIERQYDLVHWQHRIVPLEELLIAAKEAFLREQLERMDCYVTTALRVERLMMRLDRYNDEVRSLLAMDENIASYRGNEIMKTLTVFTVICTPATVFAALWGMNFENLPGVKNPVGYIVLGILIILLSGLMYGWLRWKGWTGDLIRGKKKNSNIV